MPKRRNTWRSTGLLVVPARALLESAASVASEAEPPSRARREKLEAREPQHGSFFIVIVRLLVPLEAGHRRPQHEAVVERGHFERGRIVVDVSLQDLQLRL